jgi:alpha-galactosidase
VNDPDVVFCRTRRMGLSETEKELIALVDGLLASQIMFSDDTQEFGEPEEAAFTARVVGLYDSLADREYGAERVGPDVYSIFSRDGRVRGVVNLSNRPWSASGYDPAEALVLHAARGEGALAFEPRSMSVFEE